RGRGRGAVALVRARRTRSLLLRGLRRRNPPMSSVLIGVLAIVGLVVLLALFIVTRIKVAGPNEAFIVTGRKGVPVTNPETGDVTTDLSGQKVVMGASVFVIPFVQRLQSLDLSS